MHGFIFALRLRVERVKDKGIFTLRLRGLRKGIILFCTDFM